MQSKTETETETKKKKKTYQEFAQNGVMVGYFLPPALADKLALAKKAVPAGPDGAQVQVMAADDLHITLAMLGDIDGQTVTEEGLKTILTRFASYQAPLSGEVSGTGRFTGEDPNAFYASVDIPALNAFREGLVSALSGNGATVSREHGFTPHITLAFLPDEAPTPQVVINDLDITIDRLYLAWGDKRSEFKLAGYSPDYCGPYLYSFSAATLPDVGSLLEDLPPDLEIDPDLAEQGFVAKYGKIFEVGNYPDKKFKITAEEMQGVIERFKPGLLDIEHRPSLFDGKLGYLAGVSLASNGKDVFGRVLLTKPAAELLKDIPIKVSTTWGIDEKTGEKSLEKLALTTSPRVADAVVMHRAAAFSHQEVDGEFNRLAEFVGARNSASDKKKLQLLHDTVAQMGASCAADNADEKTTGMSGAIPALAPAHANTDPSASPVDPTLPLSNPNPTNSQKEQTQMSEVPNANLANPASASGATEVALSAKLAELSALVDAQQAQLATLSSEKRRKEATEFAEAQVEAGKITTSGREYLISVFEQAAKDDAGGEKPSAVIVFSAKGKAPQAATMESRTETIRALFAALPGHNLTQELVAGIQANPASATAQSLTALFARGAASTDDEPDEGETARKKFAAEKARLMGLTDDGKKAIELNKK